MLCFHSVKPPYSASGYSMEGKLPASTMGSELQPPWQGRSIAGPKLRLVEFSAFLEQQRDPDSVSREFVSPNFPKYLYFAILQILTTSIIKHLE